MGSYHLHQEGGDIIVEGDMKAIIALLKKLNHYEEVKSSLRKAIDILNNIPNKKTIYGKTYDLIPGLEKALKGQQ